MKKYRFLLFCLFLPFLLSSCNEWLNVKPEDEIDEDDLFSTGEGYRHALNGIYYTMSLKDMYGMQMTWGVVDGLGQTYDYYNAAGVNEMSHGASTYDWKYYALEPVIESIWKGSYNVVANCNQ